MSVNLIIIVAIGLLILFIAIIMVNRSGRGLSENAGNQCVLKGGSCDLQACTLKPGYEDLGEGLNEILCPETKEGNQQYCCRYKFGQ